MNEINTENQDFLQQLQDAEMVLIGIGEEFNNVGRLRDIETYNECRHLLEESREEWLIPALYQIYSEKNSDIASVLDKFADLLSDKNYFVVSVSTNEMIRQASWREKRLVMPCGGSFHKQCMNKCESAFMELTEEDRNRIESYINSLPCQDKEITRSVLDLGKCSECGSPMVLNNIYTEKYDESGYLDQWQFYMKWLQGTLNRKLLVLELGVGMQCPSVIRWPFEKVAFFNQKASFWRVNETLYQLSEEIREKGTSISKNAIDWLRDLC